MSANDFLQWAVIVRFFCNDGSLVEIKGGGRRLNFPLEAGRAPGIRTRFRSGPQRPEEIDHRYQVSDTQNRSARGREDIEGLEFRRIVMIPPRHTEIAQYELREEGQVKTDKDDERGEFRP